ncbi:MAG TPA: carboxypeptidase-like regulatory domain-containing protein, partial [Pirellulaceae bacterium]
MKPGNRVSKMAAFAACLGMIMSAWPSRAAGVDHDAAAIRDISLDAQGALLGQVINGQGVAQAGIDVRIDQGTVNLVETKTNEEGRFAVGSLRGGVYQFTAGRQQQVIRLWTY